MAEEEVKTYNTAEKGFATRCSMHTHGTFSTPSYGGVGEPYRKDKEHDPRAQGLQFTTNKQRAGQTGANWNNNNGRRNDHKILFEVCAHLRTLPTPFHVADRSPRARSWQGEPYVDPNTYERKAKMEAKKKNLTPEGFRFSGGSKKNSGLGPAGQYGSIGPKLLHEPHFEVHKKGEPRTKKEYDPLTKQARSPPRRRTAAPHRRRPHRRTAAPPPHCLTATPGEELAVGSGVAPHLGCWRRQVFTNPSKKGYGGSTPGTLFGPGPAKVSGSP